MNTEIHYKKTNEDKLKNDFQNIILIIEEINTSKSIILEKINQPKDLYQNLINHNTTNNTHVFIFCLDSLHFQYKLSLMDYETIKNNLSFILNRMYCDYYKLYNIILLEMNEKKWIDIHRESFPKYNDLDVMYEYDLEIIIKVHNEILDVIHKLYCKYVDLTNGVKNYTTNEKSVFSISNFLNTLKYENGMLENQIMLYINYVSFFHFSQKKSLVRLYSKMIEFNKHIDEYSNIDNVISIDDIDSISPTENIPYNDNYNTSNKDNIVNDKRENFSHIIKDEHPSTNEICKNVNYEIIELIEPIESIQYTYYCTTPVSDLTENNSITDNNELNKFKFTFKNKNNSNLEKSRENITFKLSSEIVGVVEENEDKNDELLLEPSSEIVGVVEENEDKNDELLLEPSSENMGVVEEIDLVLLTQSESNLPNYSIHNGQLMDEFYQDPFSLELNNNENILI